MIPTSFLVAEYGRFTRDTSATNLAVGKERMKHHYANILRDTNNYVAEKTKYTRTTASQRSYLLPPDVIKPKSVRIKVGSTWHPLTEVWGLDEWFMRTATAYSTTTPTHYHLFNEQGNLHIELDGIPSVTIAADEDPNIELICQATQDPLYFPDDYTTGTVTIEQGSSTVTLATGTFTEAMVGRFIQPTGGKYWYEIRDIYSSSVAFLVNYFQEPDVTASTFTISEMQRTPEDFHMTPLWGAVHEYWMLSDAEKAKQFERLHVRDTILIEKKYQNKTKGNVIPGIAIGNSLPGVPLNYPKTPLTRT